ncbi:hypothetical protein [Desulfovirgula thermocuniculi]|uniref:hypothetical protein n=1 Tax=Desulfovirgula thermocuniculi TaxID=348842 RepID=UPI0003FBE407|nr:hypothetical protein [Desulfovirgula thermocuniculi]
MLKEYAAACLALRFYRSGAAEAGDLAAAVERLLLRLAGGDPELAELFDELLGR